MHIGLLFLKMIFHLLQKQNQPHTDPDKVRMRLVPGFDMGLRQFFACQAEEVLYGSYKCIPSAFPDF
jgi:hypothetical protein